MSRKYKFENPLGLYFTSTATVGWVDVFSRRIYKDLVIDSLQYCTSHKGLILYGYALMTNHIHLIISRQEDAAPLADLLRDFKKYTAMQVIKAIKENLQESRREWLLRMFEEAGRKNANNRKYQFWQQHNQPIGIEQDWIDQKLEYIHNNPVKEGIVAEPEHYFYSSARNYAGMEAPVKIKSLYDGNII